MVGIDHRHHHLTCILQVCLGGQQREGPPNFPKNRRGKRMGARGSSLVASLATNRGEDDCEREGPTWSFLQRNGGRLPTYGIGGGV